MLNKIQFNQINSALLQLGFSNKEADVYLSVVQDSETSVLTIAKGTGLSRGTVFDIVERLKAKGYLAETKQGKRRRIVIDNPTAQFYSLLQEKHSDIQKAQKIVDDILPLIKSFGLVDFKPQIRVYTGELGFRKVWDDIFSFEGKRFVSIARMETFVKFAGEDFLTEIQERKAKLGFSSRAIHEDSVFARQLLSVDEKYNRETKIAPKEYNFPSTEIIYGDKIAMFSTREENIVLVLESKDFAQTHRTYFEMLWKFLEKPN